MVGVRATSSLTVLFLLLLASFSAAREERSTRAAATWTAQSAIIPYLAIVKHGATATDVCSGSIPSISTVLTYCEKAATGNTAYAGLLDATAVTASDVQEREVESVANAEDLEHLKICKVDNWKFGGAVSAIELRLKEERTSVADCKVEAFRKKVSSSTVHVISPMKIGGADQCTEVAAKVGLFYSKAGTDTTLALTTSEPGGPAVCQNKQWAIIMKSEELTPTTGGSAAYICYSYVNIAKYSPWIEKHIKEGTDGTDGTDGSNSTSPSSGYSIHSYLNKYSKWKVLGFLVPTIVTFLQY